MNSRPAALAVALVLSPLAAASAFAFDGGCRGGRTVECYEKVQLSDRYATVERQVVVRPASREVVTTPAVVARRAEVVEVAPARVHSVTTPAVYGTVMQRVQVAPARVDYTVAPAVVQTVREQRVIAAGGHRWEHSRGLFGRERLCKVATPPVVRTVERDVVVAPARRIPIVRPAVYQDVARPVLLQAASTRHVYQPAVTQVVERNVVVRPASTHVVNHPAVVAVKHEQVRVGGGGTAWRAIGAHGHAGLTNCGRC